MSDEQELLDVEQDISYNGTLFYPAGTKISKHIVERDNLWDFVRPAAEAEEAPLAVEEQAPAVAVAVEDEAAAEAGLYDRGGYLEPGTVATVTDGGAFAAGAVKE